MLQRLTLPSPLHQFPHPHRLPLRQPALEFQINLQPWQSQHMRQQQLSLQPRRIHPLPPQELRAAPDHFKDRHKPKHRKRSSKAPEHWRPAPGSKDGPHGAEVWRCKGSEDPQEYWPECISETCDEAVGETGQPVRSARNDYAESYLVSTLKSRATISNIPP